MNEHTFIVINFVCLILVQILILILLMMLAIKMKNIEETVEELRRHPSDEQPR